ncbi:general secretion pathway protein GspB [Agaribacterium haliotis]|uniref:general secretion pathway protein GspB n=1 Tax=Agaribacterium haliotis TaxID=2013869 RepID=UPI000BB56D90|nr:general secretion pathway protein GspB [Agaribacterium haliotis]
MSLILDALKKAEHERSESQGNTTDAGNYAELIDASKQKHSPLIIVLVVVSLILLTAILWLIYTSINKADNNIHSKQAPLIQQLESAKTTPEAPAANEIKQSLATRPQQETETPEKSGQTNTTEPTQNTAGATSEINQQKKTGTKTISTRQQKVDELRKDLIAQQYQEQESKEKQKDIAKLYQTQSASQASNSNGDKRSAQKTKAASPSKQARQVTSPANDSINFYGGVFFIKGLPLKAQENIPTLMYGGHIYQPDGGSYVTLNGKPYREGASVSAGIVLEKILRDGIVMRQGNTQFKMQALNSWLNY